MQKWRVKFHRFISDNVSAQLQNYSFGLYSFTDSEVSGWNKFEINLENQKLVLIETQNNNIKSTLFPPATQKSNSKPREKQVFLYLE